jgi:plasmid stabilization system protein ParE
LAKPADSSEGAAARIKKDVEEAAARRVAVRYLGTVDCRYWPEAEQALIDALRADKIECVRYEAALALQRGCCCTKKVAKALTISIEGSDKDGNPAERSARVQDAAAVALSMCVFEDMGEKKDEIEAERKKIARVDPKNYYRDVDTASNQSVYGGARKALESRNAINSTQVISQSHRAASQGLIGIFSHAVDSTNESAQRAYGIREPQTTVVTTYPQQPQRRGVLYKLLPGSGGEESIAYNPPAQVVQPAAPQPVAAAPSTVTATIPQPKRLPASNEIRPVGYVASPTYGTMATDDSTKGFSTSGSSTTPSRPTTPMSPSSSATPRPEGLLGLVIMNDANRK